MDIVNKLRDASDLRKAVESSMYLMSAEESIFEDSDVVKLTV